MNNTVCLLFLSFMFTQDVLKNEDLDLDTMFVASLVADLIKVSILKNSYTPAYIRSSSQVIVVSKIECRVHAA